MIKIRKAQNAIEFMIIFTFILVVIGLVMFVIGKYLVDAQDQGNQQRAENFADNINKELTILTQVDEGYYRELMVLDDNYDINISPSQLIVRDKYNDNKTYYFDLIGSYNITKINKTVDGINRTFLVFQKQQVVEEYNGIDITETVIPITAPAYPSNLDVAIENPVCTGGKTPIIRFADLNGSHGGLAANSSYPDVLCVGHSYPSFTIGTSCSGVYDTLFYFADINNSHVYINNSNAWPGSYNWQEVCISSTNGAVDIRYQAAAPNVNYECVASVLIDDVFGGLLADCTKADVDPTYTKIWLSVD